MCGLQWLVALGVGQQNLQQITRLNIPLQGDRGRQHCQLGLKKLKPGSGLLFGKNMGDLISRRDEGDCNVFLKNLLTHKVVVHLNVLGTGMVDWIGGECKGADVITPHNRSSR
jgi:hypothetical protein